MNFTSNEKSGVGMTVRFVVLSAALMCLALALAAPVGAQTPEPTATPAPADTTPEPADATPAPADTTSQTDADVRVTSISISPDPVQLGDTAIVTATVTNFGDSEQQMNLELAADGVVVDSISVTVPPRDTQEAQLRFTPTAAGEVTLAIGEISQQITVSEPTVADPTRIPVGPTVRLRPNRTVITSGEDAIIDMFWDNSIINPQTYMLEVTVDVPIGLYLYSADGAMGCGAGTCKGLFEIPPANVRNLPLIVKADEVGRKFIHMNGRYFPQDAPEMWNPISLTVPIEVREPSRDTSAPTPVPEATPTTGETDTEQSTPWWLTWPALVVFALVVIALIAVAGFWAISRTGRSANT